MNFFKKDKGTLIQLPQMEVSLTLILNTVLILVWYFYSGVKIIYEEDYEYPRGDHVKQN